MDDNSNGVEGTPTPPAEIRETARWEPPELIAVGTTIAAVGLFIAYLVSGIDYAVQISGLGTGTALGVSYATDWVLTTLPLILITLLSAWWSLHTKRTGDAGTVDALRWKRLRPCIWVAAILSPLAAAAGIARLVNSAINYVTLGYGNAPTVDIAADAGFCIVAVAVGLALALSARRLLHPVANQPTMVDRQPAQGDTEVA